MGCVGRSGGGCPRARVAKNVWEFLRNGARQLRRALEATPRGAMLLIIGGLPCQQLSSAGPRRGRLGLAGG
eukprot:11182634-Lingulodinium_polyedra.AAC.1